MAIQLAGQMVKCPVCARDTLVPGPAPPEDTGDWQWLETLSTRDRFPVDEKDSFAANVRERATEEENPYRTTNASIDPADKSDTSSRDKRPTIPDRFERFGAAFIDAALERAGAAAIATAGVGLVLIAPEPGAYKLFALAALLAVSIAQWGLIWATGQSIGKRLMGMEIVRIRDYQTVGLLRGVVLRAWIPLAIQVTPALLILFGIVNFRDWIPPDSARIFDMLPGFGYWVVGVDALWIFTSSRNRCLHDLIAGTIVISKPRRRSRR
jgi:uncharacterized RDD family membrane protein YckC